MGWLDGGKPLQRTPGRPLGRRARTCHGRHVEEHAALEECRAEEGITLLNAVLAGRIVKRHQADRLDERRIWPGRSNDMMPENASVEGLMLRPDRCQQCVGTEELAGDE